MTTHKITEIWSYIVIAYCHSAKQPDAKMNKRREAAHAKVYDLSLQQVLLNIVLFLQASI